MSRIIAGRGKGRRLKTPGGLETRPTGARVKQTLFDILAPVLPGSRFLDAFAGAGGIGLEARSRGASKVVLVDVSAAAVAAIKENLRALEGLGGDAQVFRQDARVEPLLQLADRVLAHDGLVVAEHFHKRALPETIGRLARAREVRVGDHRLTFYRRHHEAAPSGPSGRQE